MSTKTLLSRRLHGYQPKIAIEKDVTVVESADKGILNLNFDENKSKVLVNIIKEEEEKDNIQFRKKIAPKEARNANKKCRNIKKENKYSYK